MGVFASGQYVRIGLKSAHFSPAMDLPWMMSVRRATSAGEKFQVWQHSWAMFQVLCEGRGSPYHVLAMCTISESGGMMSGGVKGCNVSPSWAVMRHTRIPVEMTEASLSFRSEGISSAWTNSPVCAVSSLSEESCEKQIDGW